MTASPRSEPARPARPARSARSIPAQSPVSGPAPDRDDSDLLAALLDGMDTALCAFDADGVVTHWNREAERILGWTAAEAVGRKGLAGWAAREADADEVQRRLMAVRDAAGRRVHEFALVTKDGGRVLVRTQSSPVPAADGRPTGVYCAFSEVRSQIDLERSIALSEALLEDASWHVVLVDADLRVAVVNGNAARALRTGRRAVLGRPLGDLLDQGVEEVESALQHVLAEGAPPAPTELWVTLREADEDLEMADAIHFEELEEGEAEAAAVRAFGPGADSVRRCWRSGFLRLASPLTEEPVPLGVAWIFQDVTEAKAHEQDSARMRFRGSQLHRAARAAAECEDPMEAVSVHLDFALAGFADHALLDLVLPSSGAGAGDGGVRLVRVAATPCDSPGPCPPTAPGGIPVAYPEGHPALQAVERCGAVRASAARTDEVSLTQWTVVRKWPDGTVHALCAVLRSRGRTLGVATFLRGPTRRAFDRTDAVYAEDVAARVAAAVDLAGRAG
ncbi:PAS domain-containing protein [Streptomyces sp. NA02950]|uniref:PAS domain-containing protein n=1 Tax=Streptomyces sp. NA02950 TaxID=2742137 RepID=UPI0020CAAC0B|nr:PAS domain-containing protein [Streptomyces sp. NA02950]